MHRFAGTHEEASVSSNLAMLKYLAALPATQADGLPRPTLHVATAQPPKLTITSGKADENLWADLFVSRLCDGVQG